MKAFVKAGDGKFTITSSKSWHFFDNEEFKNEGINILWDGKAAIYHEGTGAKHVLISSSIGFNPEEVKVKIVESNMKIHLGITTTQDFTNGKL